MRVVVWNFHGVIVDDIVAHLHAFNAVLDVFDKPRFKTVQQLRRSVSVPYIKSITDAGIDLEEFTERAQEIDALYHKMYLRHPSAYKLRGGVVRALKLVQKKGATNILLTNTRGDVLDKQMDKLGLSPYFSWLSRDEDGKNTGMHYSKNERLAHYFKDRAQAGGVMIGNSPEDPALGRAFGLVSVAVSGGWFDQARLEAAKPQVVVHSLREAGRFLNKVL